MTNEKTYKCEISIKDNDLSVTSPTGTTISISVASDTSDTLTDIIEALKLTRADVVVYELPESVMGEISDIANRTFTMEKVHEMEVTDTREILIPEVVNPIEKLNFPLVESRQVYHYDKDTDNTIEAPDNKAIVNSVTGMTYAIVSNRYKLLKHEDAIAAVSKVLERENLTDYKVKAELSNDGAVCSVEWVFPKKTYEVQEGDFISPSVKMINSYDTSMMFNVFVNGLRLVCLNGMTRAEKIAAYTKKHTTNLNLKKMQSILTKGLDKFSEQIDAWKQLTVENVDQKMLEDVKDIFTQKDFKEVMRESEVSTKQNLYDFAMYYKDDDGKRKIELQGQLTKWILYNIATQYITHKMVGKKQLRAFDKLGQAVTPK